MILIYPGTRGPTVRLVDVLRDAHEALRSARHAQIEARRKRRIPLDDTTDWGAVEAIKDGIVSSVAGRDSAQVASLARDLVDHTDGNAIEEIGEYVPDPAIDGVTVTMQVVSAADRRMWQAETSACWARLRRARIDGDIVAAQRALVDLDEVASKVVSAVVVDIGGTINLEGKSVAEAMPALILAGMLTPLYAAASHFLELPTPKAVRCGLPPQSI